MNRKCRKCSREVTYVVQGGLCDWHWADWLSYGDKKDRKEILEMIRKKYGRQIR